MESNQQILCVHTKTLLKSSPFTNPILFSFVLCWVKNLCNGLVVKPKPMVKFPVNIFIQCIPQDSFIYIINHENVSYDMITLKFNKLHNYSHTPMYKC